MFCEMVWFGYIVLVRGVIIIYRSKVMAYTGGCDNIYRRLEGASLCYRKCTRLPVVCTKYLDGRLLLERTCLSLKVPPHPLSLRLYRFAPRPWFRRLRAGTFSLQTVHEPELSPKCVFCYVYFSLKVIQCYSLVLVGIDGIPFDIILYSYPMPF